MTSETGVKLLVLEQGNIDRIKEGKPLLTPDKPVLVAFTPDPVWLADRLMDTDGDAEKIAALIEESAKRPQKDPLRPTRKGHLHKFHGDKS